MNGNIKHGHARRQQQTPEYRAWAEMLKRCRYEKFKDFDLYGGRGIAVCEKWADNYPAFLADMGLKPSAKHSLDRMNSNGNYQPGNCRWATKLEQGRNRRGVHILNFNGEAKTISEWAAILNVPYRRLQARIYDGWPVEMALLESKKANQGWRRKVA
jgi:hypothetical protein